MSRETLVPSIPDIRDDNIKDVLRAIKSMADVREGRIGDPLDQLVTMRDLKDIGLVSGGGTSTLTNGTNVPVVVLGGETGYNPATDYTTPPAPTGLSVTAGFSSIYLVWDGAPYRNHSLTEVWRSESDQLGSAVMVGTTASNMFADAVGKTSQTYYYWVRFVSVANIKGPYNSTAGTIGGTGLVGGVDLSPLIITADKIASGAIDLGGTKITGLLANANMAVISDPTKIADYIISNTKLADLAVTAGKIASGAVTLTKFASGIEPVSIVTGSLPTTKSTSTIVFNGKLYRWNGSAYTAAVDTTDLAGTISDAQIAGLAASKVTGQLTNSQIADIAAAKLTGQITNTQISDDSISTPKLSAGAITSAKIAANTIVAGNIAAGAITATEIAAGTITGSKIAAGTIAALNIAAGTISGDKIAANTITGSNIAADTITAAQIAAGAISASELAAGAVTAGKIAANAIVANDGVIANAAITNALIANLAVGSAQIADAAITSAKIGNLAVGNAAIQNAAITNLKVSDMAVDKLTTGTLYATMGVNTGQIYGGVNIGQTFGSSYFGTGFYLGNNAGTYKFYVGAPDRNMSWDGSNLVVKGIVYASAGVIGGSIIDANSIRSGQTSWNSGNGFYLGSDGKISFGTGGGNRITWDNTNLEIVSPGLNISNGNATFAGTIEATSGHFSGDITGATGKFTGSLAAGLIDMSELTGDNWDFPNPGTYPVCTMPYDGTVRFTIVGAGGGGGGGGRQYIGGPGGAGGVLTMAVTDIPEGTVISVNVGYGGSGGSVSWSADSPQSGSPGGTTTLIIGSTPYPVGGGSGGSPVYFSPGGYPSVSNGTLMNYHCNDYGDFATVASATGSVASYAGSSGGSRGGSVFGVDLYYRAAASNPSGLNGGAGVRGGGGGGGAPSSAWVGSRGFYIDPVDGEWGDGVPTTAGGSGGSGYAFVEIFNPNAVVLRGEWDTFIRGYNTWKNADPNVEISGWELKWSGPDYGGGTIDLQASWGWGVYCVQYGSYESRTVTPCPGSTTINKVISHTEYSSESSWQVTDYISKVYKAKFKVI